MKYHKGRPFYVLSQSPSLVYGYHQGEDETDVLNYPKESITDSAPATKTPKITPAQKARKWVDELREMPIVWAWVGWLATHHARFRASVPEHLQSRESERLSAVYGVAHEIGATLTGNKNSMDANGQARGAQGPSYTVVYDDFGFVPQFEALTGIIARPTEHTQDKLSTQQWQPVLVLLLSDLQFKLSAKRPAPEVQQEVSAIRRKVPSRFLVDFDAGSQGDFSRYFVLDKVEKVI